MKTMKLSEIAAAVGGIANGEAEINGVCIDSRLAEANEIYIAINGERFDGHDFTKSALANGAAAAMIHHDVDCDGLFVRVEDTAKALRQLAHYMRNQFDIPVVGLTGSVGKTTTKEMTAAVLSEKYNTLKTEGNLNNNIGLPRTLLRLEEDTEAAVIEMGMSNRGEISELSQIAEPTVAIISNIGVSHMESLGSRENILKAKLEILDGLRAGCPIILNGDDPYLMSACIEDRPVYYYGIDSHDCDYRATDIVQLDDETSFTVVFNKDKTQRVTIPTVGIHNVYNALAAFAAGMQLSVTPEQAAAGLKKYVPSGMRQRIKLVNGIRFIEDCYNASPDSQRAALRMLAGVKANRRIAVLGDMLELGSISDEAHRNAGLLASKNHIDILFTYGEKSVLTANNAVTCGVPMVRSFLDKEKLADALAETLQEGDAVLFKASRGMALEDVINAVYEKIK